MDDANSDHTPDPRPAAPAEWPVPAQQPTEELDHTREPRGLELSEAFKRRLEQHYLPPGVTVDQLAAEAAARRAGHKGRHHWAGHSSGRMPWKACGEWRPVAGVRCPVCPDVCPGCGSVYHNANPFPVDPRDG